MANLKPKQKKMLHASDKKHMTPHATLPGRTASGRMMPTTAPAMPGPVVMKPPLVKPPAPKPPAMKLPMSNILPSIPMRPAIMPAPVKQAKRKK